MACDRLLCSDCRRSIRRRELTLTASKPTFIEAAGTVTWNNSPIPISVLQSSLEVEAERSVQPTLEIETDPDAQYEMLAKVLSRAKNSGMEKIAFVDPGQ